LDPVYRASRVDKQLNAEELAELARRLNDDGRRALTALHLEREGHDTLAIEN
jgi:hypothetical protein